MNSPLVSDQVFFPREGFAAEFAWEPLDFQVNFGNVTFQSAFPAESLAVDITKRAAEHIIAWTISRRYFQVLLYGKVGRLNR